MFHIKAFLQHYAHTLSIYLLRLNAHEVLEYAMLALRLKTQPIFLSK